MIRKPRSTYTNNIFLLDFVHRITDIQTLKHCVSEADFVPVFMQEALKLLKLLNPAILSQCIQKC